jgi:hypothetical protein
VSSPITIKSFYERMNGCFYYKERPSYLKNATLLFKRILKLYFNSSKTFLEIFVENFNSRSYSGESSVYQQDRSLFRDFCLKCSANLDSFFKKYPLTNTLESFSYKDSLTGYIDGINNNDIINFSFLNCNLLQKNIDFYILNNYIYNIVNKKEYNSIIMSVPNNAFFLVNFDKTDYTITRRGFIKSVINSRMRRAGDHCLTCSEQCKPTFINTLNRLEKIK